ncbi:Glutamate receptor 2.7 [Linum perenne]
MSSQHVRTCLSFKEIVMVTGKSDDFMDYECIVSDDSDDDVPPRYAKVNGKGDKGSTVSTTSKSRDIRKKDNGIVGNGEKQMGNHRAQDLIKKKEVQAILGPETSMQANFIIDLGEKAHVPVISFSASSPTLSSKHSPYFFRATPKDSTQVTAIAAIVKSFGWRQAVPIYIDNEYGEGVIPYLIDALGDVNARVPYRSKISPFATDDQIGEELYKLMTMQTRVFIVHMSFSLGVRLFAKAKQVGMMSGGYVWIMTDGITNFLPSMDRSGLDSMQGVLGVKPYVPVTKQVADFRVRWKRKFHQEHPEFVDADLNNYGLWAYDATVALAMAVESSIAAATNLSFANGNVSSNSSTDFKSLGVSRNGLDLVAKLSTTSFQGLAGEFLLKNGELRDSAYQIVNVNGNGARGIGFWSSEKGLSKEISKSSTSSSRGSLGTVIWPGDPDSVPKGFEIPTNGKKLRIGVPVKTGFSEFVTITTDPVTNKTTVTGYCIDIFEAVVQALPYALPFEYVPFANADGESAGSYNDLVYQVFLGKFDGVVADTTIIANRSLYIDFTLPYTESGVSMVVPIKPNGNKNTWVFLKPLTWDLWVTTFLFFLFIGFVVWVLEHRINKDFRGPPSHQAGTSFWFSFSTMVFAHRENVVSNLARTVVIIWCFVVLILTQSYTASFTSLLTVQQLQPTITDINELLRRGDFVGYQDGSFVLGLLERLGFQHDKLIPYSNSDDCDLLFNKGRITASFDEVPYIKLFLAKHCSKYTMIDPTYKTDGFGFVFPKGSPLVADISRAVLNVTEGDKMSKFEKAWFGKKSRCPESSSSVSPGSQLGLNSFWGLFLIAGVAAISALLIFAVTFIYQHRNVLLFPHVEEEDHSSKHSLWRRTLNLLKIFDKKDLQSHTFREDRNGEVHLSDLNVLSPSAYSVQTEFPTVDSSSESHDINAAVEEVVINIDDSHSNCNGEPPVATADDYTIRH